MAARLMGLWGLVLLPRAWHGFFMRRMAVIDGATCSASVTSGCSSVPPTVTVGDDLMSGLEGVAVGPVKTVRLSGVAATAGALPVVVSRNLFLVVAGFAMIGIGIAVVVPLVFAAAGRIGQHPGRSIAGVAGIAYGSGLVPPGSSAASRGCSR